MGQTFIDLDPAGYKYVSEGPFGVHLTGAQLYERFAAKDAKGQTRDCGLWNPPGLEWICNKPVQMDAKWLDDPAVGDYTLDNALWTWASGVTAVEWCPARPAGEDPSVPRPAWVSVAAVPDPATEALHVDLAAIATAAGLSAGWPAGMKVIGCTEKLPGWGDEGTGAWQDAHSLLASDFTPCLDAFLYAEDPFVFGFHDIALVLTPAAVYVLRKDTTEGTWALLETISGEEKGVDQALSRMPSASLTGARPMRGVTRQVLCAPVYPDWLCVQTAGATKLIRLRTSADAASVLTNLFATSAWWVAGIPGRPLDFHAEVTGYKPGVYPPGALVLEAPAEGDPAPSYQAPEILFDTGGSTYCPTAEPVHTIVPVMPGAAPGSAITWTARPAGWSGVVDDGANGAKIEYQIVDETGAPWVSAGNTTHHSGGVNLRLVPTDDGAGRFFRGCQVRRLEINFPVVLQDRECLPVTLSDLEFVCRVETDYREALGKRFTAQLLDIGPGAIQGAGFDRRFFYPVHWYEVHTEEGVPVQDIRARAWVERPKRSDPLVASTASDPLSDYAWEADAQLRRADKPFRFLPQLVIPDASTPGFVEHTEAVREALRRKGFEVDDPDKVYIHDDSASPVELRRLPGTWGQTSGEAKGDEKGWQPDWDKSPLDYCLSVAREWAGWVLYERLDGRVMYHPDLVWYCLNRGSYYTAMSLYRSPEEAYAYGAPGMWYEELSEEEVIPPEGNEVIVVPKASDGKLVPQVIVHWLSSVQDPTEGEFFGEWVPVRLVNERAVNADAAAILAQQKLYSLTTRRLRRASVLGAPPWAWTAPVDVGEVVELVGIGKRLVTHIEVQLLARDLYRTRLTCEALRETFSEGGAPGAFPGSGV